MEAKQGRSRIGGVNAARRTLGRWLLAAFLERGCDPATARVPRRVFSIRPLTRREMAELNPLADSLVPVSNLLPLPLLRRRYAGAP
ncbi:MAG: hypothetical protein QOF89_3681 [Acidobacteriota bacterium]|nr:hypothetical protein [Acidobacteriota bacterium]